MYKVEPSLTRYFTAGLRRFFSGMALSRLSGLGRDLAMAYAFGDHPAVAAFLVAFRFANLLRRFFGEGPLQSAFIPHFEGLKIKNPEEAYSFFRSLLFLIGGLVLAIIGLGEVGLKGSLPFFSAENRQIALLTGWMLPALFFISLYGLNVSLLQCHQRFFVSSMAPSLCNMVWIGGALYLKNQPIESAMFDLAKWVLAGFVLQWGVTVLPLRTIAIGGRWSLFHPEVKRLAQAFSLGALGVGGTQINSFIDAFFARFASLSGPVYLWYANRFEQLALSILGIAAVNTLVPLLSRAIKKGEIERGKKIFSFGCRRVLMLMIPMTFAIGILGYSALDFIFGHGHFSPYAVAETAKCLTAYALGLVPATLIMFYSAVLYAEGNFKTSTYFSLMTVLLNIALNALFVFGFKLGPVAIALATSVGAWCNFLALRRAVKQKGWVMNFLARDLVLVLSGALIASVLSYSLSPFITQKFLALALPGMVFVGVCVLFGVLFRKRLFNDRAAETEVVLVKDH